MSISPNLMVMARAIEKAARSLIRDFNEVEKLQISVKGPGDFVSKADKRSEEILVESLMKDRPDWGVMGEEGTDKKGKDERYRWIIDPLDGTSNFLHALPHWCITVGLEKDGEIVAGMTFDPVRQEMFRTEKGGGAFVNNTRLRVSGRKELKDALVEVDPGRARSSDSEFEFYQKVQPMSERQTAGARFLGSGALGLAYVAAGRTDVFIHCSGAKPWDIAAGLLMVREAAGIATDLSLKPAGIMSGQLLAASPGLHAKYAELIGLKKA